MALSAGQKKKKNGCICFFFFKPRMLKQRAKLVNNCVQIQNTMKYDLFKELLGNQTDILEFYLRYQTVNVYGLNPGQEP